MSDRPVELIPLVCSRCQTPIPARPDEVAWVCAQCGQGLLLDDEKGATPIEINYAAGLNPAAKNRPFWVARGVVEFERRVFGGGDQTSQARQFWDGGRTFFIPAFQVSLDELVNAGTRLLQEPPALHPGPAVPFLPVAALPDDVKPYAEFIFLAVEAARKDRLKEVQFKLTLEKPVLWVLQ